MGNFKQKIAKEISQAAIRLALEKWFDEPTQENYQMFNKLLFEYGVKFGKETNISF